MSTNRVSCLIDGLNEAVPCSCALASFSFFTVVVDLIEPTAGSCNSADMGSADLWELLSVRREVSDRSSRLFRSLDVDLDLDFCLFNLFSPLSFDVLLRSLDLDLENERDRLLSFDLFFRLSLPRLSFLSRLTLLPLVFLSLLLELEEHLLSLDRGRLLSFDLERCLSFDFERDRRRSLDLERDLLFSFDLECFFLWESLDERLCEVDGDRFLSLHWDW